MCAERRWMFPFPLGLLWKSLLIPGKLTGFCLFCCQNRANPTAGDSESQQGQAGVSWGRRCISALPPWTETFLEVITQQRCLLQHRRSVFILQRGIFSLLRGCTATANHLGLMAF